MGWCQKYTHRSAVVVHDRFAVVGHHVRVAVVDLDKVVLQLDRDVGVVDVNVLVPVRPLVGVAEAEGVQNFVQDNFRVLRYV